MTAATSVRWSGEFTAFSTIFLDDIIGAPPTIGFPVAPAPCIMAPPLICAAAACASISAEAAAPIISIFFMSLNSSLDGDGPCDRPTPLLGGSPGGCSAWITKR